MELWRSENIGLVAGSSAIIGGICALYLIAVPFYMLTKPTDLNEALVVAMLPFIPGDILKAVLAGFITSMLAQARPASLLSRD